MFNRHIALGLLFGALAVPTVAQAAAFCVRMQGAQPECLYDDAGECRRRAAQIDGLCTVNPDVVAVIPTNGKYCVVSSARVTECQFVDRRTCEREAERKNGVCIDSTTGGQQPNPHREDPRLPY